jgi:chromosome segregation ATPase
VLVEHPFRPDWELVEPKDTAERTREVYRFAVNVAPDQTQKLSVREQRQMSETLELVNTGPDVIAYYLKAKQVSPKVKAALEKAVSLRDQVSKTMTEINRREQRVNEISQEQSRIRENMTRLNQSSELYNRYVKTLDRQETEMENLRREIKERMEHHDQQQRELNDYLLNLEVE